MSTTPENLHHFELISSADLSGRDLSEDILLISVAAPENHGPHLPLGTDMIIGEELAKRVGNSLAGMFPQARVWLHPPLHLGGATIRGVGSVKVPSRILRKTLKAYLRRFLRQGFRRFVLISAHGGVPHAGALDDACAYLRRRRVRGKPVQAVAPSSKVAAAAFVASFLDEYRAAGVAITDEEAGDLILDLHAGRMETSMMLAIDQNLVRASYKKLPEIRPPDRWWLNVIQKMFGGVIRLITKDEAKIEWFTKAMKIGAADLSWIIRGRSEGYVGWPAKASVAEGKVLLTQASRGIAELTNDVFNGRILPEATRSAAYLLRFFTLGSILGLALAILFVILLLG